MPENPRDIDSKESYKREVILLIIEKVPKGTLYKTKPRKKTRNPDKEENIRSTNKR